MYKRTEGHIRKTQKQATFLKQKLLTKISPPTLRKCVLKTMANTLYPRPAQLNALH